MLRRFLRWLFPPPCCVLCGRETRKGAAPVCPSCMAAAIVGECPTCGRSVDDPTGCAPFL